MRIKYAFTPPGHLSPEELKMLNAVTKVSDRYGYDPEYSKKDEVDSEEKIESFAEGERKKSDILPLGVAAASGASAYALASSLIGNPDEKRDSLWMRVVKKLIPWGAAGAGAYAGYKFSKKADAYDGLDSFDDVEKKWREKSDASGNWSNWYKWGGRGAAGVLGTWGLVDSAKALRDVLHNSRVDKRLVESWLGKNPEYASLYPHFRGASDFSGYISGEYERANSQLMAIDKRIADAKAELVRGRTEDAIRNLERAKVDRATWQKRVDDFGDYIKTRSKANVSRAPSPDVKVQFSPELRNVKWSPTSSILRGASKFGLAALADLAGEWASSGAAEAQKAYDEGVKRIRFMKEQAAKGIEAKQPQAATR